MAKGPTFQEMLKKSPYAKRTGDSNGVVPKDDAGDDGFGAKPKDKIDVVIEREQEIRQKPPTVKRNRGRQVGAFARR